MEYIESNNNFNSINRFSVYNMTLKITVQRTNAQNKMNRKISNSHLSSIARLYFSNLVLFNPKPDPDIDLKNCLILFQV